MGIIYGSTISSSYVGMPTTYTEVVINKINRRWIQCRAQGKNNVK